MTGLEPVTLTIYVVILTLKPAYVKKCRLGYAVIINKKLIPKLKSIAFSTVELTLGIKSENFFNGKRIISIDF